MTASWLLLVCLTAVMPDDLVPTQYAVLDYEAERHDLFQTLKAIDDPLQ